MAAAGTRMELNRRTNVRWSLAVLSAVAPAAHGLEMMAGMCAHNTACLKFRIKIESETPIMRGLSAMKGRSLSAGAMSVRQDSSGRKNQIAVCRFRFRSGEAGALLFEYKDR